MKLQTTLEGKIDPEYIYKKRWEKIQEWQKIEKEFDKINENNKDYWICKELIIYGFNNFAQYVAKNVIFNQDYYVEYWKQKKIYQEIWKKFRKLEEKYCNEE